MSNLDFTVDISQIEDAVDELEEDIQEAADEAAKQTRKAGLREAKHVIRTNDRVWNREVLNNWVPVRRNIGNGMKTYGFVNYADHARVVDEGATYTDKKPPIEALMPYVMSNFTPTLHMSYRDWAFWLQEKIFRDGISGIHYTDAAVEIMEESYPYRLKAEVAKRQR